MKEFKIYSDSQGNYDAVKSGWSWPAFFFGFIWALIKKMWLIGIGIFVLFIAMGFIEGMVEVSKPKTTAQTVSSIMSILTLIVVIIIGKNGNKWREKYLLSRGYKHLESVIAKSPKQAIALWLKDEKKA